MDYIIFDELGVIKDKSISPVIASSDKVNKIYIVAEFDQDTTETAYRCFARFKRSDGFVIGPIDLPQNLEALEIKGSEYATSRVLTLRKDMLQVSGPIQITVVFDKVDAYSKVISTKATGLVITNVYDAVEEVITEDEYNELKQEFLPRDLGDLTLADALQDPNAFVVRQGEATKKVSYQSFKESIKSYLRDHATLLDLGYFESWQEVELEIEHFVKGEGKVLSFVFYDSNDGTSNPGLLFSTYDDNFVKAKQILLLGNVLRSRDYYGFDEFGEWIDIDLTDIESMHTDINDIQNAIYQLGNSINTNTDNISDLDTRLNTLNTSNSKKLDKETIQEQTVNSSVQFLNDGGIKAKSIIGIDGALEIGNTNALGNLWVEDTLTVDKLIKQNAPVNESMLNSMATVKYVKDKTNEVKSEILGGATPEQLDTIKELAAAFNNDPNIINVILQTLGEKADKSIVDALTTQVNSNTTNIATNTNDISVIKGDITSINTALDQKANNADLAPVLNLVNLGYFEGTLTTREMLTEELIDSVAYLLCSKGFDSPINVGIRSSYMRNEGDYSLTLTDLDLISFSGFINFNFISTDEYDCLNYYEAVIEAIDSSIKATPRTNSTKLVRYFRRDSADVYHITDWERIAYTSDLEELETAINSELAIRDTKIDANADTIDNIISGKQVVGRAMLATNLINNTKLEVPDTFGSRITATNNNEIEGVAEIYSIGGQSVKQIVKDSETTCELAQNNIYLAKASGTDITLSNSTQTINLTNGVAKFTANADGTYIFNGANLANCKVYSLTEMGIASLSLEQVNQLLGYKFYPFGITNTKPKTFKSIGENLWDYKYFYDTLKAVNADNISYVEKDGRECIKITDNVYRNIPLYEGKFASNVQYKFSIEGIYERALPLHFRAVYTDGTNQIIVYAYGWGSDKWKVASGITAKGKTVAYIDISPSNSQAPLYINISKFQLQMLDNPEDQFLPYTENTIQIPQVYQPYGMPSLPNGVRDEYVRVGEKWYFNQEVGRVVLDGSDISFEKLTKVDRIMIAKPTDYIGKGKVWSNELKNNLVFELPYTEKYFSYSNRDNVEHINNFTGGIGENVISIIVKKGLYSSLNDVIETFSGKEIYYQLATPVLTPIPTWLAQYLAYNYGREEILDISGNPVPTSTIIKYYLDNKKQIETNTTNIADLLVRVQALESK